MGIYIGSPTIDAGDQLSDPFENDGQFTDARVTFCRIYEVSAVKRTCSIKTFGSDPVVSNADYENVQWLSSYTHPEGDESGVVPRTGAVGVCIFAGGTPWIIGFFQPLTVDDEQEIEDKELEGVESAGASAASGKEKINEGDYIMRSLGNSRMVMRAGGEIELVATSACSRTYFPTDHRITENCYNLEQTTLGGNLNWGRAKPDSDLTMCRQEFKTDSLGTDKIIEYWGSIVENSDMVYQMLMGEGASVEGSDLNPEPNPVIKEEIYATGKREYLLRDNMYFTKIDVDGSYTKGITDYAYYEKIDATGEVTLNINNKLQQKIMPDGEISLITGIEEEKQEGIPGEGGEGKFDLSIKPTGDVSLNIAKKVDLSISNGGEVTINSGGGKSIVKIDSAGNVEIMASTKITAKSPLIDLKGDQVKLGSSTSDVVPMGKLLVKAVNKIIAGFNSHKHLVPQSPAGMNPSQPPDKPLQAIVGTAVLSNTVKVQG